MRLRMVGMVVALLVARVALGQSNRDVATGIEGVITVSPIRPGPIRAGSELPSRAPLTEVS